MGFRIRFSKRLGPFRLTFGRRGIGVSAGIGKLFRIGWHSSGRVRGSVRVAPGVTYERTSSTRRRKRG